STWESCARITSASPRSADATSARPGRRSPRRARRDRRRSRRRMSRRPRRAATTYVPSAAAAAGRANFATIAAWIARGSHVLDLGCGDGSLLAYLARERGATGYGIEIDTAGVLAGVV